MSTDATTDKVSSVAEFACQYCGEQSSIVRDDATGEPSLLHPHPACAEFIEMDVADTLRLANDKARDARPEVS